MGSRRRAGLVLAGLAACTSGIAVFINSYGVKQYPNATAYTTAKNLVAAVLVLIVAAITVAVRGRRRAAARSQHTSTREVLGLLMIAVVGGSVPFVLFFEGLARASAKDAAFIHKTMVIWVAILAVTILEERFGWGQVAAIGALVVGQALLGVRFESLRPGGGELMILLATLLWSVEVVVAKRLLVGIEPQVLALARMGLGSVLLLGWLAVQGEIGALIPSSSSAAWWVVVTGLTLGAYVLVWYSALSRAPAIDVTAVLVFAVVITALLDAVLKGASLSPQWAGLVLVTMGAIGVALLGAAARGGRSSPATEAVAA